MLLSHKTHFLSEDAEWVIFVHGAGGSSNIWYKQIKDFKKRFNVLLVDLRGHGKSQNQITRLAEQMRYTFKVVTEDIIALMDHLAIEKAHFVGISLGTILIRNIAELVPERVESMVLGGAILDVNLRSKVLIKLSNAVKHFIPFLWLYKILAWILMPYHSHKESRRLFIREAKNICQIEFLKWFSLSCDLNPLLKYFESKDLKIPTLYLMGEFDHMFLKAIKSNVVDKKSSVLRIIKDAGHVCNVDAAKLFNEVSINFIDNGIDDFSGKKIKLIHP